MWHHRLDRHHRPDHRDQSRADDTADCEKDHRSRQPHFLRVVRGVME